MYSENDQRMLGGIIERITHLEASLEALSKKLDELSERRGREWYQAAVILGPTIAVIVAHYWR